MNSFKDITKLSRVFYKPLSQGLQQGRIIELKDPQLIHYIGNVIRLRQGQQIRVFNDKDGEFLCEVAGSNDRGNRRSKDILQLEVLSKTREIPSSGSNPRQAIEIELVFSPIRKENTKLLLEKCNELGINRFSPILTKNCQHERLFKQDTGEEPSKDLQSFHNILIQSTEQSERLTIPTISPLKTLAQLIKERQSSQAQHPLFVCRERSPSSPPLITSLKRFFANSPETKSLINPLTISVLVGPEGGFQQDELHQLSSVSQFVSLGENVLKAETAGITSISTVQYFLDDYLHSSTEQ